MIFWLAPPLGAVKDIYELIGSQSDGARQVMIKFIRGVLQLARMMKKWPIALAWIKLDPDRCPALFDPSQGILYRWTQPDGSRWNPAACTAMFIRM
jgi:hypothetical protein